MSACEACDDAHTMTAEACGCRCHAAAKPALDIAAIRARADAATQGPWAIYFGSTTVRGAGSAGIVAEAQRPRDAAFILAARTDAPALCDALEAAQDELARLRAALVDALEGMEDMRPYVPSYYVEKWGHDDYIARAKDALGVEP